MDYRLYWLLAELLNAKGDVQTAFAILDECVKTQGMINIPLLKYHRSILTDTLAKARQVSKPSPTQDAASWSLEPWQVLVARAGLLVICLFIMFQIKQVLRRGLRITT